MTKLAFFATLTSDQIVGSEGQPSESATLNFALGVASDNIEADGGGVRLLRSGPVNINPRLEAQGDGVIDFVNILKNGDQFARIAKDVHEGSFFASDPLGKKGDQYLVQVSGVNLGFTAGANSLSIT